VILSATVLLLQLAVVQQGSVSRIGSIAAPSPRNDESPAQIPSGAGMSDASVFGNGAFSSALPMAPANQPVFAAPLEPGRLTPTPLVAAGERPASELPVLASSAPAAFVAPAPTDNRARLDEERRRRLWLGLAIAESSTATFDAWTTRRVISSGEGHEMDPLLRPFAGNASLYAVIQVAPLALDYLSWRMMHSHHEWERRIWWLPQSLSAGMSLGSGAHNLGVR